MIIKLLKILLAAIMMLFVLVALNNVLNLDNKIIIILVNGTAGILIYSILCKILKIEEFNEVIDMIKNKVSKKRLGGKYENIIYSMLFTINK